MQRFGSALNAHTHLHGCAADGVFAVDAVQRLRFYPAADLDVPTIEAEDRAGLERLLRYCARPAFASEQLTWDGSDRSVRYTLPKLVPTGQTEFTLSPLELLDRLAALIPLPRRHRHHYFALRCTCC